MSVRHEVIVVGGGQAGLAMGYFLARHKQDFAILEAAHEPAAAWRDRWESLKLFTSARYDSLPGRPFPGDPNRYPTRDEVVDYLGDYAAHFELPVELDSPVRALRRNDRFLLDVGERSYEADQVVVATGPFQTPRIPSCAGRLGAEVTQLHSSSYRNPDTIAPGRVLVVGGGNSGYQIAADLADTHEVDLAIGSRQLPLPQRILGRDLFWYLDAIGALRLTKDSRLGRRLAAREDTLIGSSPRQLRRQHAVTLHGRVTDADGRVVRFADGSSVEVSTVIWATGFRVDLSWIDLPVLDGEGRLIHNRGVSREPGLYFLGQVWQHTRGSALLGWVKDDAEYIAQHIGDFRAGQSARGARPHPSHPR
ncbi:putative flavoprotein involved in K+ transport [Nocardioides terrae]|uniref:Putative flavoprotein involved in K+ transport n=1 Tax=Nocardioides terrae TaxID=574651 RepID=A0A1I1NPH3_9ACTN|nr:NAD(P)-binding domain-containing protein [Nocardioides terrae]SFC96663.1 putative flavoprotein involved in K+ transport [Nocardioides terrae]